MSEVKHTPGPWHVKPGDETGFKTHSGHPGIYAPARQSDDYFVLMIAELTTNVPTREIEANARLIALAPEMYEYIASSASNGCATAKALISAAEGRASTKESAGE